MDFGVFFVPAPHNSPFSPQVKGWRGRVKEVSCASGGNLENMVCKAWDTDADWETLEMKVSQKDCVSLSYSNSSARYNASI